MANYHWKMLQEIGRVEKEMHALWIGNLSKQQRQRIYDATKKGTLETFTCAATPRSVKYVDINSLLNYNSRERAYGRPKAKGADVYIISGAYKYKACVNKPNSNYIISLDGLDLSALKKNIWLKIYYKEALLYRTIIDKSALQGEHLVCDYQIQQEIDKVLIGRI